jgi:pyruvate dehydrogenase E2 component (dihydrolipoamide acetyltransferase)
MSRISMTMLEGKIVKWLKAEGDAVTEGEPLVAVETDKVTVDVTAPGSGLLRKILVPEGAVAQLETSLCVIADKDEDISAYLKDQPSSQERAEETVQIETAPEEVKSRRPKMSPLAKKLASERNVDIAAVVGSGPAGLITKEDIERILAGEKEKPRAAETPKKQGGNNDVEIVPLDQIRKRIADHLILSKQNTAAVTTVMEVDMTEVAACRKVVQASYTTFVVKAASKALQEYRILNSSLNGEEIHIKQNINICVAVATEAGLITPVIRNADIKNLLTVHQEMDQLAAKGREKSLGPNDFSDGTFTITNSGIYGSLLFTPIINYPQCAILGMGKVQKTPVVRGDAIVAVPIMYLCLTYDHRIIDGATAVQFVSKVKSLLEKPDQIIF